MYIFSILLYIIEPYQNLAIFGIDDFLFIAIVSTVVAGAASAFSASSTNSTNREIAEQNQQFQAEENQKAREFQEQQTIQNRLYNSPASQVERYRQAGLNPFMASGSSVSSGDSVTSAAPALQGAPNMPNIVNPLANLPSQIAGLSNLYNDTKTVDSNVANQSAQTRNEILRGAVDVFKHGGSKALDSYLKEFAPFMNGEDIENSYTVRTLRAEQQSKELQSNMDSINNTILQKYGESEKQQIIWNLQQQASESVTKCGLYNSLAKLNDSNIELNNARMDEIGAQIEELTARAYKEWSESSYVQKLGLTEDQKRFWFISDLALGVSDHVMANDELSADYEANSPVREQKRGKFGKSANAFKYVSENALPTQIIDFVTGRASNALGVSSPLMKGASPSGYFKAVRRDPKSGSYYERLDYNFNGVSEPFPWRSK